MPLRVAAALVCSLLPIAAFAQARPEFEVASIRPSADQVAQVDIGVRISGSQVHIAAMSLKDYIGVAYRVKPFQVAGPEWITQLRYDVSAKIPDGVAADQVPEMLQSLLASRFALTFHRESRELPVYALIAAEGGPKLQESAAAPDGAATPPGAVQVAASGTGRGVAVDLGGGSSFSMANRRIEIRRMTMAEAAEMLERFVDRPMIDATGLAGRYDVTLELAPEDYAAMMVRAAVNGGVALPPQALRILDGASSDPLSGPLQAVGLTLESRRVPLEVLVIDSALQTPTEN